MLAWNTGHQQVWWRTDEFVMVALAGKRSA
jgi:hypothetical protein